MRLQNEDDEYRSTSVRVPTIILVASLAIFGVLAIVLLANNKGKGRHTYDHTQPAAVTTEEETVENTPADTLTANDLNFWDMYSDGAVAEEEEEAADDPQSRKDRLEQMEADMKRAEEEAAEKAAKEAEQNADPATDGKHTKVTHIDGTSEWITINSSIKLNTYEDTGFQSKNGILGYYSNGRETTKTGADISQYTSSIDWDRLSTEVDYVMIRVGARGYDSGNIIADTKFLENVTNAAKAKIPFGVYFSSQAITETEAKEEAAYVMTQLAAAQSAIDSLSVSSQTADPANTNNTNSQNQNNPNGQNNTNTTTTTDVQKKLNELGIVTDRTKFGTTTSVKDNAGKTTTTAVDNLGNITVTVTDENGNVTAKKTVNLDPYGNVTTVETDETGKETINTVNVYGDAANQINNQQNGQQNTNQQNANQQAVDNALTQLQNNPNRFKLAYPVAIEMHMITNDISRIESVDKTKRTEVLTAFCDAIEKGGYESMIAANKEFLLCQVNTAGLSRYDIWLSNEGNLPDYPYMMSMWKYSSKGSLLKSMTGDYGVDVGFIDYTLR